MPPFFQILLLFFAWKIRKRFTNLSRVFFYFGLGSLYCLSMPIAATYLAKKLECEPALAINQIRDSQADAIVILSSWQNDYTSEYKEPVSAGEQLLRIRYGAFLQRKTELGILLSGGAVFGEDKRSLAETMAYDLETGYGGKATWLEKKSRTTFENAKYSYNILAPEEKTTILLVTSASHMMRAKWCFEQVGFTVYAAPTNFTKPSPIRATAFLPSVNALDLSSQAIREWLGWLFYRLQAIV